MSNAWSIGCLLLFCVSTTARAADVWVDVVNGSDANAGTSPASAWRTLTHASTAAPAGSGTTIHVAPGTYSPASGEIFPLVFDFQWLRSDGGPAVTIIDGGGTPGSILVADSPRGSGTPSGFTGVSGFTLQNANKAIDVRASWNSLDVTVQDCLIRQTFTIGISANTQSFGFAGGVVHMRLVNTIIEGVPIGVGIEATFGIGTFEATDCTFRFCFQSGIDILVGANPTTLGNQQFVLRRCRFESNGYAGVAARATNLGSWTGTLEDCLIAQNGNGYVATAPTGLGNHYTTAFRRCTIADNLGPGVYVPASPSPQVHGSVSFESTLIVGNSPDVDVGNVTLNAYSQIGGSDPLFYDRASGDYRLRFGSPCVDVGDPATPAGPDLAGAARPIDGNLDTQERADIGAFEHAPLWIVTTGRIGTPLRLEMSGPNTPMSVFWSRGPLMGPIPTQHGNFHLNPTGALTLGHFNAPPFPPATFMRPIPNDPVLIGRKFTFQGLLPSPLSPSIHAYTNAVSVTIGP